MHSRRKHFLEGFSQTSFSETELKRLNEQSEKNKFYIYVGYAVGSIVLILLLLIGFVKKSKAQKSLVAEVKKINEEKEKLDEEITDFRLKESILATLTNIEDNSVVNIRSDIFRIGRRSNNDYIINNTSVSGGHAEIRYTPKDNSFLLVDLQSTNGTFVNGKKITKATLHDGDIIEFGAEVKAKFLK